MEQRDTLALSKMARQLAEGEFSHSPYGEGCDLYSSSVSELDAPLVFKQPSDEIAQLKKEVSSLKDTIKTLENNHALNRAKQDSYTQRFERLLQQLPCGVIMLDGKGLIEHINDYAARVFNQIKVGESWLAVIQREFSPREDDGHEISLRNGRRVTLDTASLDDASGQIVILLDLTETRNLQSQLSHQQRLVEMGKMMASLAHQIRTPLSTAMLYSSHMASPVLEKKQRVKYAHKLQNRLECINQQINDMLIYVRGGVELDEWVEVADLFDEVTSYCKETARPDGSTLTVYSDGDMALVRCNKVALIGALGNLIQNAFQSQEEPVAVNLSATVGLDQKIIMKVADNGPGIHPEKHQQAFTPFYTTKSVGTGLGLPIVKTVIEAHGGDIYIDPNQTVSAKNTGCSFVITLPAVTGSAVEGGLARE